MDNDFGNDFDKDFDDKEVCEGENDSDETVSVEVKPTKLGRLATTAICVVGVIIVIIILLTIKGCSIEKVENNSQSADSVKSAPSVVSEVSKNGSENSVIFNENSANSVEVSSASSEILKSEIVSSNNVDSGSTNVEQGSNNNDGLLETAIPVLGEDTETSGIVTSKKAYIYKDSYVYGVAVSVLIGDRVVNCQYFCPKNTFDALIPGDSITVVYQVDTSARVSIKSIMK